MKNNLKNIGLEILADFEKFERSNFPTGILPIQESIPLPNQYFSLLNDARNLQNISASFKQNLKSYFPHTFASAPDDPRDDHLHPIHEEDRPHLPGNLSSPVLENTQPQSERSVGNEHSGKEASEKFEKPIQGNQSIQKAESQRDTPGKGKNELDKEIHVPEAKTPFGNNQELSEESDLREREEKEEDFNRQADKRENTTLPPVQGIGALSEIIHENNDGIIFLSPEDSGQLRAGSRDSHPSEEPSKSEFHPENPQSDTPDTKTGRQTEVNPGNSGHSSPLTDPAVEIIEHYFHRPDQREKNDQLLPEKSKRKDEFNNPSPVKPESEETLDLPLTPGKNSQQNTKTNTGNQVNKTDGLKRHYKQHPSTDKENENVTKIARSDTGIDTDEIIEAFAKHLYLEYKRFYGN